MSKKSQRIQYNKVTRISITNFGVLQNDDDVGIIRIDFLSIEFFCLLYMNADKPKEVW